MTRIAARAPMRLTADLVARSARSVEDAGPGAGKAVLDDDDYEALLQSLLAAGGWRGEDVRVFAYGSLLWKPVFDAVDQVPAVVPGWHRAFRIRLTRFRGTPEQPGLMMALDRGGSCRGALCRIAGPAVADTLRALLRREITFKPPTNMPRWVMARTPDGTARAIAFTANRAGPNYVGGLTLEQTADILARAAGHWGSGAEYLMQTIEHLERLGIRDANLWRLQALVADRLMAPVGASQGL